MRAPLIASTLLHAAAIGLVAAAGGALLPGPPPERVVEVRLVGSEAGEPAAGPGSAAEAPPPSPQQSAPAGERRGARAPGRPEPGAGTARRRLADRRPEPPPDDAARRAASAAPGAPARPVDRRPEPSPGAVPGTAAGAGATRRVETPAPEAPAAGTVPDEAAPAGVPAPQPAAESLAASPVQGEEPAGLDPTWSLEGVARGERGGAPEPGAVVPAPRPAASGIGSAASAGPGSGSGSGAPDSAGNDPGGGRGRGGGSLAAIAVRLRSATRYPLAARLRGAEGTATVRFRLGPGGGVEAVELLRSSGDRSLDEAALEAVRRGAPYPAAALTVEAPIVFDLEEPAAWGR